MSNTNIKIAIIEDQVLFAESLKELLLTMANIGVVDILDTPSQKAYRIPFESYDIFLIDINLPFSDGFEISEKIKERNPAQKIALLSAREDRLSITKAKEMGIEGYLFKSAPSAIIEEGLHAIINGKEYYQQKTKQENKLFTFQDGTKVLLTERELVFLELLLQELTTKEIASEMFISEHTVIGYRKALFQKLNVSNMIGLAKYALEILR